MEKETGKKYIYDAFISYRHSELDKFVAENLHKQLEAFRLPGNVSKKAGRKKIERVFRDKDELPLTSNLEDPIMQALRDSEFLIVICSPRLRESLWCKKEIETFIRLHGREKVFAVLIEGEPEESFPEELLFYEETVEKPDGTTETVKKPMEPLAADVRGSNKRQMLKAMRTEILRLMAPMFSLTYDDLRQRHRERKMRRILIASLTGAVVCFAFGTISTAMVLQIQAQKEQIQAQSSELRAQSMEISIQNRNLLEHQAVSLAEESLRQLAAGDRIGAIETARQALTEYDGLEMPYTTEAQYALMTAMYLYDNGSKMRPQYQMETAGVISLMTVSQDRKTLLTYDRSETLTIWDIASGTVLGTIRDSAFSIAQETDCVFLDNNRLLYTSDKEGVLIYDIAQGKVTDIVEDSPALGVYADKLGKYFIVRDFKGMRIYDTETLTQLYAYTPETGRDLGIEIFFSDDSAYLIFAEEQPLEDSPYWKDKSFLYFWNLSENVISGPIDVGEGSNLTVRTKDDVAYLMLNYSSDDYMSTSTVLRAYDLAADRLLWSREYDKFYGDCMQRPYAEGAHHLLLASSYDVKLVDMADGSEYASFVLSSMVAEGAVFSNMDRFLLLTQSGEQHIIVVEEKEDYLMAGVFMCHSQNVSEYEIIDGGYLVLPHSDNHVTVYEYNQGEDMEEYSGEVTVPETNCLIYQDAIEYAREKGLPKTELARSLFFSTDESLMFVFYSDNTLEIYDTADMSLKNSVGEIDSVSLDTFFGTDKDGNLFVGGGGSEGYMLNPDGELLARIDGLCGVEQGGSRLFRGMVGDTVYSYPIYSLEELLAKAEAYVLR